MTNQHQRRGERGFTLIELLTIIGIIGVLAMLSMSSFRVYRASAAYAAVQTSLNQARVAMEASLTEPDVTYADVSLYEQTAQGRLLDDHAAALLPQFQVSRNTKFTIVHDSACLDASCVADQISIRHKSGTKYAYWMRFGDGLDILVENAPGAGF